MKKYISAVIVASALSLVFVKIVFGQRHRKKQSQAGASNFIGECGSDDYHDCKKGYYSPLYCRYPWWISHG